MIDLRTLPEFCCWPRIQAWLGNTLILKSSIRNRQVASPSFQENATQANQKHFEPFVHRHERDILNYLWRLTADEQTAYDLTQETFMRAWEHFSMLDHYDQPRSWLFRVATNLAKNHHRRQRHPIAAAELLNELNEPMSQDPMDHYVESELVHETLQALSPNRRAALILREVYGLSPQEVGRVLGMSTEAVRMALCRGREQFRQIYVKKEVGR